MDDAKKYSIAQKIIFIYLILFPFGQLIRITIPFDVYSVVIQPIDVIALIALIFFMIGGFKKPPLLIGFIGIVMTLFYTWILSLLYFSSFSVVVGLFYILRIIAYAGLFFLAWNVSTHKVKTKDKYLSSLFIVIVAASVLGWIQYIFFSDLREYVVWGWDDHLYRMAGTFFDPGYLGILLVFGFITGLGMYFHNKNKNILLALIFLLISIGLTYSRASFISLIVGVSTLLMLLKKFKIVPVIIVATLLMALFLPRPSSAGVQLERLYSVYLRVQNYKQTMLLWNKFPLFGVGYNNLCLAKKQILADISYRSHSCSGADSSILFILATSGVVGFLVLVGWLKEVKDVLTKNYYTTILLSCFMALLVHSFFHNSMVYSWVLGWIMILLSLSVKSTQKSKA